MPEIQELNEVLVPLKVTYPGSEIVITVQVRANEYTGEWIRDLGEEKDGIRKDVYWMVSNLVSSWDLTERVPVTKNGKETFEQRMIPLDTESLKKVPLRLLNEICTEIHKDQTPNRKRLTPSENSW